MSEETRKVLALLKDGKITTEDAERLLAKLGGGGRGSDVAGNEEKRAETAAMSGKKPRYLRIQVDRPGQKEVNIRMPLAFVRNSQHLLSFLPRGVAERLEERGLFFGLTHLGELSSESFAQAVEDLNVDIDQEGGKKVKIYCE